LALDMVQSLALREFMQARLRLDRSWAVSHLSSGYLLAPCQLLSELGSLQRADTPERLQRYLARLAAIPRYLGGARVTLQGALDAGQVAPGVVLDRTIDVVERSIAEGAERSAAMRPVEGQPPETRERVARMLENEVVPAYGGYLRSLRGYRESARETIGLGDLPDGPEMYAAEIEGWTTLAIDPAELHRMGTELLASVHEEASEVADRLGFDDPRRAIEARMAEGTGESSSREEVLELVRGQVERSWNAASTFFGRLPDVNCEVCPVARALEEHVLDHYIGPSDDGRSGVFYVNCAPRPLHSIATTTYHESNPGHHFQFSFDLTASDRPAIRRFGSELQGAAFAEGWGLYSERLADEMDLYVDDYERLGMLELQALRAARLVVDTGIHAFGWPRDGAIAALEDTGLPRWKAAAEVDRYVAVPGQALCYVLGQMEIQRGRSIAAPPGRGAEALRRFHDRLLSLGALPLETLRREMSGVEHPHVEAGDVLDRGSPA
jgi:uncharacterized protein (DUF885 family)